MNNTYKNLIGYGLNLDIKTARNGWAVIKASYKDILIEKVYFRTNKLTKYQLIARMPNVSSDTHLGRALEEIINSKNIEPFTDRYKTEKEKSMLDELVQFQATQASPEKPKFKI